eukprot:10401956-Karenia_brevis.AAC.1
MIQGVETQQGEWVDQPTLNVGSGVAKEACSVEKGWWIGAVTKGSQKDKMTKETRQKSNRFESLNDEEDVEDEEDEPPRLTDSEDE